MVTTERSQEKRRLAAIVFTDIVGFTSAAQKDESHALKLLDEHNQLVRKLLPEYDGREVKTVGDAFLLEFPSALQAVQCSIAIQEKMRERNSSRSKSEQIDLRIGVHVGDVVQKDDDILGDAVNISSRIQPFADPGGICVSQQIYDQVRNKIHFEFDTIEPKSLKNVNHPVNIYKIVMPWDRTEKDQDLELDKSRIAVLPLKNMSPDPNDEYFAEGMTEELITALSGVRELTVIARTSIMQYKTTSKRVSEIGRDLRTGTLIEGSVRKAANKVRISVQVVDAATEGHLWAQNYDRTMDDIFAIQSEIAESVAGTLRVKLAGAEKRKLESRHAESVEGYTLYLKGRHFWNERNEAGLKKAVEYFKEAIKRDPDFALGYAGLADSYYVLQSNRVTEPEGEYSKSKEYALRAISLNESLAEPHATVASILLHEEHDFKKAEEEFKQAIELNPNYATAHQWYCHLLGSMGRMEEALTEIRRALELDPLSPIINVNMGDTLYYSGNPEAGLGYYGRALEISPGFHPAYGSQLQPLCYLKRFDRALEVMNEYAKVARPIQVKLGRAYVMAHMRRNGEARTELLEIEKENASGLLPWYAMALAYFVLGEVDKGFEFLEKSYQEREHDLMNIKVDREFSSVREDQRYISLLKRIGLS